MAEVNHYIWFGLVWCCVVWFGVVWFGLAWFGFGGNSDFYELVKVTVDCGRGKSLYLV